MGFWKKLTKLQPGKLIKKVATGALTNIPIVGGAIAAAVNTAKQTVKEVQAGSQRNLVTEAKDAVGQAQSGISTTKKAAIAAAVGVGLIVLIMLLKKKR